MGKCGSFHFCTQGSPDLPCKKYGYPGRETTWKGDILRPHGEGEKSSMPVSQWSLLDSSLSYHITPRAWKPQTRLEELSNWDQSTHRTVRDNKKAIVQSHYILE